MTALENSIVGFASSHVGEKEKPGNTGFLSAKFEEKMKAVGFDKGESWCCLFAELCWTEAFSILFPDKLDEVSALFSEGCLTTWANAKASKVFKTGTTPKPGSVAIFQHGTGWQGHAAIVTTYNSTAEKEWFHTIEGNTNAEGGREGIEVAKKKRRMSFVKKPNQLNLMGFIYPD